MPLGISPSVRPITLCSAALTSCFDGNILSPTLPVQHDSSQKVVLSLRFQCEQNAASDTYAGITPPFAPEYIGKAGYVNKNLGFVRKAEQRGRVIGLLGQCTGNCKSC